MGNGRQGCWQDKHLWSLQVLVSLCQELIAGFFLPQIFPSEAAWKPGCGSGCSWDTRPVVRETMCLPHCIHLVMLSCLCLRKQKGHVELEIPCANPYPCQERWVVIRISGVWKKKRKNNFVSCHWSINRRNSKHFLENLVGGGWGEWETFALSLLETCLPITLLPLYVFSLDTACISPGCIANVSEWGTSLKSLDGSKSLPRNSCAWKHCYSSALVSVWGHWEHRSSEGATFSIKTLLGRNQILDSLLFSFLFLLYSRLAFFLLTKINFMARHQFLWLHPVSIRSSHAPSLFGTTLFWLVVAGFRIFP
jgi:hypothetical protein